MPVLDWNKPAKVLTTAQWAEQGFEDGPLGAYMPNMSDEDKQKWKAKLVGHTTAYPR